MRRTLPLLLVLTAVLGCQSKKSDAIVAAPTTGALPVAGAPSAAAGISGKVLEWLPPQRFSCTWRVEGMAEFAELPECIVTYDIAQAGEAVRLTMTEFHNWNIPEAILAGGRSGWPAILSNLKSVLETGKPMAIRMEPPKEMLEAVKKAVAEKPWLK